MAESTGLSYSADDIEAILAAAVSLELTDTIDCAQGTDEMDKLRTLKREQIKTLLHGTIMTGYLKANAAPPGLLVKNEPFIFQRDLVFKKDWSLISWHCTRDWLVLIIKTATCLSEELKIEIHTIEVRLKANQTIVSFKKRLEELNRNMSEFETTLKNSKIVKLKRDIAKFSHKRVYP